MSTVHIDEAAIPVELRDMAQWVVWRLESRKNKPTKVPYNANTGKRASSVDPKTWSTFNEALETYRRDERYTGIGYVFGQNDSFFGIDLDSCRNPQTGDLTDWALVVVAHFNTYTEVSPGGFGVKLVARGKLPDGSRNVLKLRDVQTFGEKAPEIAVYDSSRFWCLTGQRLPSAPATCEERQNQLDKFLAQFFPSKKSLNRKQAKVDNRKPKSRLFKKLLADCANADEGQRSERDFALCVAAIRNGWPRDEVWTCVRSIGKFAECGERYFNLTWQRAQEAVTSDQRPTSSTQSAPNLVSRPPSLALSVPSGRTDIANARRLVERHGNNLRWCDAWRKWLCWDGRRWAIDSERRVEAMAKNISDEVWRATIRLHNRDEVIPYAKSTASDRGIRAMLLLARSEPGIPIHPAALDDDPWLFSCENGTLDLRTGDLRPHHRADMLTKLCSVEYDPNATCPHWEAMLQTIMGGHADLVSFLQRVVGYSLTGDVTQQMLFILWGTGANGKSTFLNAIIDTMGGDYAMQAPDGLLMVKNNESHPTERADLFGKRFVSSVEVEDGRRLSESLVKQLTGGERIRARRMRENFWEFPPSHKIFLAANHKPVIRGTDHGIWRRVKLIPFIVTIPDADQDKELPEKLKAERAGILAWAVRGCLDWQREGLSEPEAVTAATDEYRREMDVMGEFLAEHTISGQDYTAKAGTVYAVYSKWCQANGEFCLSQRRFGLALTERGFERYKNNGTWYRGFRLREGAERTEPEF